MMMMTVNKHKSELVRQIRRFLRAEEGVSALEYALVVGVVATVVVAALVLLGAEIDTAIDKVIAEVKEAAADVDD